MLWINKNEGNIFSYNEILFAKVYIRTIIGENCEVKSMMNVEEKNVKCTRKSTMITILDTNTNKWNNLISIPKNNIWKENTKLILSGFISKLCDLQANIPHFLITVIFFHKRTRLCIQYQTKVNSVNKI